MFLASYILHSFLLTNTTERCRYVSCHQSVDTCVASAFVVTVPVFPYGFRETVAFHALEYSLILRSHANSVFQCSGETHLFPQVSAIRVHNPTPVSKGSLLHGLSNNGPFPSPPSPFSVQNHTQGYTRHVWSTVTELQTQLLSPLIGAVLGRKQALRRRVYIIILMNTFLRLIQHLETKEH